MAHAALGTGTARKLSVATMLAEAANAARKGSWKVSAGLLGAAGLAYRYSGLGIAAEVAIRLYQYLR